MSSSPPSILYLHGLNSSPLSQKASQLSAALDQLGLADRLRVPALHHHPRQAIAQLEACITACETCAAECESHDNPHCSLCAKMCRECAEDCRKAPPLVK